MVTPIDDMKVRVADDRKYIEIVIGRELLATPLEGMEKALVKYGEENEVDPLLAVAIMKHESNYCLAYANWHNDKYHNCSGIMNGGQANGLVSYPDYEAFVKSFMELLGWYIHTDGRDTISAIGSKYAPVSSHYMNASWNGAVTSKYHSLWKTVETSR